MIKTIYFSNDLTTEDKVKRERIITDIIGEDNMCDLTDMYDAPYITVRCTKEQWEDILLKTNTESIYMMW